MDIVSHGLWGGLAFGGQREKRRFSYWLAFLFGILPDFISFAPHFVLMILGPERHSFGEPPPITSLTPVTFQLYSVTHSLIVFLAVFLFIRALRGKFFWEMGAWGLHVLMDIPTHTYAFFPTPFLWPISSWKVNGISWGTPWFLVMNYVVLFVLYAVVVGVRRKKKTGA